MLSLGGHIASGQGTEDRGEDAWHGWEQFMARSHHLWVKVSLSLSPSLVTASRTVWSLIYAKNNSRIQNWSLTDWETDRQTDRQAIVSCHLQQQEQQHLPLLRLFMILLDFHNHFLSYFFSILVPTTFQPTFDKALALVRSLSILENGRARSSSLLSTWYCQYEH